MIEEVARRANVSTDDIYGRKRHPSLSLIRRACWYLLKVNAMLRVVDIEKLFDVNYSAVFIGISKMEAELEENDIFAMFIWDKIKDIRFKPKGNNHNRADALKHLEKYLK